MNFEKRKQHSQFSESPLNVSAKISFGEGMVYEYRRTSIKKDETDPYHHDLARPYTHNTIFARGVSAFNREDIYDLIVFLVKEGSRNFIIRVIDETRFTRNTTTAIKIYDFLVAHQTTFLLQIDGEKYDYVADYYSKLREKFVQSESSSLEKSRISKMTHQKLKKSRKNRKELKTHFMRMMFVIGKDVDGVSKIVQESGMRGLQRNKLIKFEKQNRREIMKLSRKKRYDYAKCHVSGDYFVAPRKYAMKGEHAFSALGIGSSEVMKNMFTEKLGMNYLCCPKESFPELMTSDRPMEEDAGPPGGAFDIVHDEEPLNMEEIKWLTEIYNKQYTRGDITIEELTEKMSRLFS